MLLSAVIFVLVIVCTNTIELDVNSRYLVIPVNLLGLANRLRIIASAQAIATASNRNLVVAWQTNDDCVAQLSDLFDTNISMYSIVHSQSSFESSVRHSIHDTELVNSEVFPQNFLFDIDSESPVVTMWTRGTHSPSTLSCVEFLRLKQDFYRGFQPSQKVRRHVERVISLFPEDRRNNPVVGVHIRAYDSIHDWPVVSPLSTTQTALRFDEASSLDSFIVLMQRILSKRPGVKFFLASNSQEAKNLVLSMFPSGAVITLPSDSDSERSSVSSMQLAAAEFWLLGQSDVIVHSRGSSFGREAANFRNIPVVDVSYGAGGSFAFYTQDASQQYCAMPEYIRVSSIATSSSSISASGTTATEVIQGGSTEWDKVCYYEGPPDDSSSRQMCTVEYVVCRCDLTDRSTSTQDDVVREMLSDIVYCPVSRAFFESLSDDVRGSSCTKLLAESNGYSL